MPNWCSNTIYFSGDTTKLKAAIADAVERQRNSNNGELILESLGVKDGYFFEIYFESPNILRYYSRWKPNIGDVANLCKTFKVSAHHEWEEEGGLVYGRADYRKDGSYDEHSIPFKWFYNNVKFFDEDVDDVYTYKPTGEQYETLLDLIDCHYKYPTP